VTIQLNARVQEINFFGHLPIQEARGFQSELEDIAHFKSLTTAPWNPEKITREWQLIDSIDQLAVKPVMTLTVKGMHPRYEPGTPAGSGF
jgi:hypothetical protein